MYRHNGRAIGLLSSESLFDLRIPMANHILAATFCNFLACRTASLKHFSSGWLVLILHVVYENYIGEWTFIDVVLIHGTPNPLSLLVYLLLSYD